MRPTVTTHGIDGPAVSAGSPRTTEVPCLEQLTELAKPMLTASSISSEEMFHWSRLVERPSCEHAS